MSVVVSKELIIPVSIEVGTVWTFEYGDDGIFEVPADGKYQVEMHGGGSGCAYYNYYGFANYISTGGGSGELHEVTLSRGQQIEFSIGEGSTAVKTTSSDATTMNGEVTIFGDIFCYGGTFAQASRTANNRVAGAATGSIATSGTTSTSASSDISGGLGNSSKPNQTYGNGGGFISSTKTPQDGQPGAIIITYLGKE